MHKISHLRIEVGSAESKVCPEGEGKAGVGYGDPIMSRDEQRPQNDVDQYKG